VLYINSTRGSWDRSNLTRQQTPMDLDFTVYNPKQVPYTVTKVGYNITMNDVPVGAGETERGYVIDPASTETIRADTAIRNENLDEWWVTHLQRNQVTDLYIDFYLIVEVQGEQFRVDMDSIDYEKQIETDIFGTKNASSSGSANSAGAETATPTQTDTDDGLLETSTETSLVNDSTEAGDSALDTETANGDLLTTVANSGTATPTETATDDGVL
jgi:LEA14-like dessication related protein